MWLFLFDRRWTFSCISSRWSPKKPFLLIQFFSSHHRILRFTCGWGPIRGDRERRRGNPSRDLSLKFIIGRNLLIVSQQKKHLGIFIILPYTLALLCVPWLPVSPCEAGFTIRSRNNYYNNVSTRDDNLCIPRSLKCQFPIHPWQLIRTALLWDSCPEFLFNTTFDCLVVLIKDIFEQTAVISQAICGSLSTTEESNIKRTQFVGFIKKRAPPWIDTRQDETKHKYMIVS